MGTLLRSIFRKRSSLLCERYNFDNTISIRSCIASFEVKTALVVGSRLCTLHMSRPPLAKGTAQRTEKKSWKRAYRSHAHTMHRCVLPSDSRMLRASASQFVQYLLLISMCLFWLRAQSSMLGRLLRGGHLRCHAAQRRHIVHR